MGCEIIECVTWAWPHPSRDGWSFCRLVLRVAKPCIKFEVSRFSRSEDISWGVKYSNIGHVTLTTTASGTVCHRQAGTCYDKVTESIKVGTFWDTVYIRNRLRILIGWQCKPVLPVDPRSPRGPNPPGGPVAPVAPVGPHDPVSPVSPVDPVKPVAPVGPVAPRGPGGPEPHFVSYEWNICLLFAQCNSWHWHRHKLI